MCIANILFCYGKSLLRCCMHKLLHERNQFEFLPLLKGPCQASVVHCSCWSEELATKQILYLSICSANFAKIRVTSHSQDSFPNCSLTLPSPAKRKTVGGISVVQARKKLREQNR